MASSSGQPQFRYTQPPSKVIHLRNLPWECPEEELIELGKPFGKIVSTKCNVGANRNQAFIEFADLNQAIAMISFYASSAEPAQIRGKTVYLQYSNRQEIVNSKSAEDTPSNVLLVTLEGAEAGDVSIDVLHLVFSAFGFVHKIATFEKTAGFQALIQFSDSETASSAKSALDGRSIPRYLLPEHVGLCSLKIAFSAHTDLNVKFQSHRSRDYTNPYLPVAPSAIDGTELDGKDNVAESNVLLASVENMQYAVTIDVLHMIFSAFGTVQKIAIFEKNAGFRALIQYPDIPTAVVAKESLEGHCLYEGGFCKLHLTYSRHSNLNVKINNDRGRDYTGGNTAISNSQPSLLGPQPILVSQLPPFNSTPHPGSANGIMLPWPAPDAGTPASAGVAAFPAQPSDQLYAHRGIQELPPGATPQMMHFSGHGSQQIPLGPSTQMVYFSGDGGHHQLPVDPKRQMMPLPPHGVQQLPTGPSRETMQLPGHGSQQLRFPNAQQYGC